MNDSKTDTNKPILTTTEVATLLQISKQTVFEWTAKKIIPSHKIGTQCRYSRREIMELVGDKETEQGDPVTEWLLDQLNKRRQELTAKEVKARTTTALND
jgi:excisionase family DNA binding protein